MNNTTPTRLNETPGNGVPSVLPVFTSGIVRIIAIISIIIPVITSG